MGAAAKQRKSGRLHEFQTQLLGRMHAACNGTDTRESRLGVVVCGRHSLVDLREAEEILHVMLITPVPLTKDWYLGLANVRGNLISVIDLDRFCGSAPQVRSKDSRVILLRGAHLGLCGFLVSSVLGLRYVQDMHLQDNCQFPPTWPFASVYLDRDKRAWFEINFAGVMNDARFLHVAL